MLEGNHIYSVVSLIVGVLMLSLALYVLGTNKDATKVTRVFIVSMCFGSFAAVLDFLLMNVLEEGTALILARMAFFFTVCMFGGFLYIAEALPNDGAGHWVLENRVAFALVIGLSALLPAMVIDRATNSSYGWGIPPDLGFWIWVLVLMSYIVIIVSILTRVCLNSRSATIKKQCTLMSVAVTTPLVYGFSIKGLDILLNFGSPPILAPGFLLAAIIFALVVIQTKMFIVEPVKEEVIVNDRKAANRLPGGSCRLIEGKKSDGAYAIFVREVSEGSQGILVSRVHPDQIKERHGLVKTPIIWLSSQPGQMRIDPSSLSILQHTIVDFMQKGSNAVVLLDGLEYLISNNGVEKVIRVIYSLRDAAVISNSKLIIPLDPEVLEPKELALFERELDVERPESAASTEVARP